MKTADPDYIARILAHLSGIPVRVFEKDELLYYHSVIRLPKDPLEACREEVFRINDHVGYHITPHFLSYGIVNAGRIRIVAGPTSQIRIREQALREIAFEADITKEDTQTFTDGLQSISRMPLEALLLMMCAVNYLLNGEKLELRDITIRAEEQETLKKQVEWQRAEDVYDKEPQQAVHNTLQTEETVMDIVRRGDSAALRQWIAAAPPVRAGVLASDELRQLRNTFIVTATLASRAAIRGGLHEEDAFSLSDAYIRRAELLRTQQAIVNLQYNMVLAFTEQVEKVRRGRIPTKLALETATYVRRHLSEPISTEKMAKEFFLSRTHFSAKFKKETGMTPTDFILNEKTEEAKRLLRYSDKSAAAIAAYLGFSSHGHFSRVFKKYAGQTPNEYREKYQ